MGDRQRVPRGQRPAQRHHQPARLLQRQHLVPVQQRFERNAGDEFHDQAGPARLVERCFEQADDAGMLQPAQGIDLALKELAKVRFLGYVRMHDLDDHHFRLADVARQIDGAHASLAEKADGLVAVEKNCADHAWPATDCAGYAELCDHSAAKSRQTRRPGPTASAVAYAPCASKANSDTGR